MSRQMHHFAYEKTARFSGGWRAVGAARCVHWPEFIVHNEVEDPPSPAERVSVKERKKNVTVALPFRSSGEEKIRSRYGAKGHQQRRC